MSRLFDGVAGYARTQQNYSLGGSQSHTASIWVWKLSDPPTLESVLLGCADGGGGTGWDRTISVTSGGVARAHTYDGGIKSVDGIQVPNGRWHHLAMTLGGGNLTLYQDGVQTGQVGAGVGSQINPFYIFQQGQNGLGAAKRYMRCGVALAAVWNTNLPASAIKRLAAGVPPSQMPYTANLLGYWPMDDDGSNVIHAVQARSASSLSYDMTIDAARVSAFPAPDINGDVILTFAIQDGGTTTIDAPFLAAAGALYAPTLFDESVFPPFLNHAWVGYPPTLFDESVFPPFLNHAWVGYPPTFLDNIYPGMALSGWAGGASIAWDAGTSYAAGTVVTYNGAAYTATASSLNDPPPSGNWASAAYPTAPFAGAIGVVTLYDGSPPPFPPPPLPGTGSGGGGSLPPLSAGGLGHIRFYNSPPWRWVVTELGPDDVVGSLDPPTGQIITFLDKLATDADIVYGLDKPAVATLSMPSDNPEVNILHSEADPNEPFVTEGRRNLYGFRREGAAAADDPYDKKWKVRFAGRILEVEDTGLTEDATTQIIAYDPWQLLYKRPVQQENGSLPGPRGFTYNDTRASTIAVDLIKNTIAYDGAVGIDLGPLHGGTSFWQGEITDSLVLDRLVLSQELTVGEALDQLVQTNTIDILMTPVWDPRNRPGIMADLSVIPEAGTIRNEAVFAWDAFSRNVTKISRKLDGNARANVVKYSVGQGGYAVPPETDAAAIALYGSYWVLQSFPVRTREAVIAFAELQLWLRAVGITTVVVEPTPERMPFLFTEYGLGDSVPIAASNTQGTNTTSKLRAALSGYQRIYGVRVTVDENSMEQIPQLLGGSGR